MNWSNSNSQHNQRFNSYISPACLHEGYFRTTSMSRSLDNYFFRGLTKIFFLEDKIKPPYFRMLAPPLPPSPNPSFLGPNWSGSYDQDLSWRSKPGYRNQNLETLLSGPDQIRRSRWSLSGPDQKSTHKNMTTIVRILSRTDKNFIRMWSESDKFLSYALY